ncbi:hypothetical protein [Arthrobacter sp. DR-2P]|nr:hypothetical protein [Arthrobacter sp. DR-2P]
MTNPPWFNHGYRLARSHWGSDVQHNFGNAYVNLRGPINGTVPPETSY